MPPGETPKIYYEVIKKHVFFTGSISGVAAGFATGTSTLIFLITKASLMSNKHKK